MKLEEFIQHCINDAEDNCCERLTNIVLAMFIVGFFVTTLLIWGVK